MLVYCIFLQLEFLSQKTRRYIFASKPRIKIKLGKIELMAKMLKWSNLAEVEFSRTSLASKLKSLASNHTNLRKCSVLESRTVLFFNWLKRKITNVKIDKARIFYWVGPNPQITCNMTSSENFKKRNFLGQNTLEWKIRSLGWCVNRMLRN